MCGMWEKDMPLKSRLGNTITRKVFKLLSGVSISDTQTGMRVFTSDLVKKLLTVEGERYEYEMNVPLFLAKEGIDIDEVPINTIYQDREKFYLSFPGGVGFHTDLQRSAEVYTVFIFQLCSGLSVVCVFYVLSATHSHVCAGSQYPGKIGQCFL